MRIIIEIFDVAGVFSHKIDPEDVALSLRKLADELRQYDYFEVGEMPIEGQQGEIIGRFEVVNGQQDYRKVEI